MWKKLNEILEEVDAVLLTSPHNLRYFSGFCGGEGVCIIGKSFRVLFVDSRYTVEAKRDAKDFEVTEFQGGKLLDMIKTTLIENGVKTIGFEDSEMSVSQYNSYREKLAEIEFTGLGTRLNRLRMIKTETELENLRYAEKIGDMAFNAVLPMIKVGVSEIEIAAEIEYQMRKLGASGTSFDTIVVSGLKSAMPHGKPDSKKIENGDFVTMDFGCVYNGYCSDMTRTVVVEKASEEQIKIYNTVLAAQIKGLETIRAGISGKDADSIARSVIESAGYGKYFGHSLGHGVGLLIHELPNLSPMSDIILEENMVVTCEPGIYIEEIGGVRIEDMVVVKNGGIENLTSSTKELVVCG